MLQHELFIGLEMSVRVAFMSRTLQRLTGSLLRSKSVKCTYAHITKLKTAEDIRLFYEMRALHFLVYRTCLHVKLNTHDASFHVVYHAYDSMRVLCTPCRVEVILWDTIMWNLWEQHFPFGLTITTWMVIKHSAYEKFSRCFVDHILQEHISDGIKSHSGVLTYG